MEKVVPYIGTWIETEPGQFAGNRPYVVPYIGTWIETVVQQFGDMQVHVVPYIGTWIETAIPSSVKNGLKRRTLYRYVD